MDSKFQALLTRYRARNAVIVADNMLLPQAARADAEAYRAAVKAKGNLQSVLLPIGNGIELSCLWNSQACDAQAGAPGV